jgi:hypothetical protein
VKTFINVAFVAVGIVCALYTLLFFGRIPRRIYERIEVSKKDRGATAADVDRKRFLR